MHRKSLIQFTSAIAIATATTTGAAAQDMPKNSAEEIVVTGSSLARQRAIDVKRNDDRIVDALGSDDLGQFPDNNVGESINRLPGVSMLVEKGEGRYVQIRGVAANLNHVTINGLSLGSPEVEDGGRQAPLDIISAGVLNRVEVIKSRVPEMDGQGIGGAANIVTQMPFDQSDNLYGRVSGRFGRESIRPRKNGYGGKDPWSVDGMVSGKLAGGTLGWLVSATYSSREYVAVGIYQDDWDASNGQPLPVNVKNNYYIIGRDRLNINGALEWRPSDRTTMFLRGFFGEWNEFQHRNRYEENFSAGVVPSGPDGGVSGPNRVLPNIRLEFADKQVLAVSAGGRHEFERITLDAVMQINRNSISEPNSFWEWRSGAIFGPNTYSVADNGVVTITPAAGTPDRLDPNLFPLRRARFTDAAMDEDGFIAAANVAWAASDPLEIKFGAKYSSTERDFDTNTSQYDPGTSPLTLGTVAGFTRGGFVNPTPAGSAPNVLMDIDAMNAFFNDPANAAFFRRNNGVTLANDFASDYALTEDVLAGYGQVRWKDDRLTVVGGVRFERTEVDSSGFLLRDGTANRITAKGSYDTWLPSIQANFRLQDNIVIRGGIGRALGRPGLNTIAPRSTYTPVSAVIGRLSIGNPNLKARTSWNYDASIEFYPDRLSSFAVALFRRDIDNDFVNVTDSYATPAEITAALAALGLGSDAIDITGLTRLDIGTTINAGSTKIEGIELSGQSQFGFLPEPLNGLGFSASATFLRGKTTLVGGARTPVQGQPKRTYSASLFFQKYGFDASVSYKWNGSYLTDLNDDPDLTLDQGKFGRIDARVAYNITDKLRVFVEGVNLNNEPTSEFQGGRPEWNTEYEYIGRTFYVGAAFSF